MMRNPLASWEEDPPKGRSEDSWGRRKAPALSRGKPIHPNPALPLHHRAVKDDQPNYINKKLNVEADKLRQMKQGR
jgi:hypothetical protein